MAESDKSYLEIKVTFIHIFVLLIAVILIGIFLFYLGFQAGKSSIRNQFTTSSITNNAGDAEKIELTETDSGPGDTSSKSKIDSEIKLHKDSNDGKRRTKTVKKESYFTIQVGAYADFSNARTESDKFSRLGYHTEILSTLQENQKLFRVRVGKFKTLEKAQKEKAELEKKDKRKFDIIKPN
ncbi:MAG: SPOR domain-containing protein [Candidatus Aminicenantes bacterium]|nr:SPOR domain-containing protein [Candidatus Aminicenantes bacterium]